MIVDNQFFLLQNWQNDDLKKRKFRQNMGPIDNVAGWPEFIYVVRSFIELGQLLSTVSMCMSVTLLWFVCYTIALFFKQ